MVHSKSSNSTCIWFLCLLFLCPSCRQDIVSDDPSMRLSFSHDSVCFDTVFTTMGSSTRRVMIYNRNRNAVNIKQVKLQDGRFFHINIDGENRTENMHDLTIRGGDSLYMFVRVNIDPLSLNSPVLVADTVSFVVNGHVQQLSMQAYGQNIEIVRDTSGVVVWENATLSNLRPWLVYDTLVVRGDLHIEPGTTLYMHNNAMVQVYGSVYAPGTLEQPITIRPSRTDRLFDSVPYRVASGQWNGIYLLHDGEQPAPTYLFRHTDIYSGTCGIYAQSASTSHRPTLQVLSSRIHNQSMYGLVVLNGDAEVINTEISNCASYCVYLAGGEHRFVHTTVASFFGYPYTNINIHNGVQQDSVCAVFINNLDKDMAPTSAVWRNCIIAGRMQNNLRVATALPNFYEGTFSGNYLQADSLPAAYAHDNVYGNKNDTVFRNIYYHVGEYRYYDFRLDSVSPARGIGEELQAITAPLSPQTDSLLWYDRLGHRRKDKPDAGCYEFD